MEITVVSQENFKLSKEGYKGRVHTAGFAVCEAGLATCVLPTINGDIAHAYIERVHGSFDNSVVADWEWAPPIYVQIVNKQMKIAQYFEKAGFSHG